MEVRDGRSGWIVGCGWDVSYEQIDRKKREREVII